MSVGEGVRGNTISTLNTSTLLLVRVSQKGQNPTKNCGILRLSSSKTNFKIKQI